MGFNVSNEFNNTLGQLSGIMGQLGSLTGDAQLCNFSGSIFTISNSIEQVKSDDTSTKVNGIMNLVGQAVGLLEKLGNIQASARQKVESDKKKANDVEKEAKRTEKELNKSLKEIGKNIDEQSDIVINATEEMTEAQEKLNETQEQINEIIKQIQEKQAKLAETTDPNEQKALLDEIYALGMSITNLTAISVDIQEAFDETSETIAKAYTEIETAKGNSIQVEENGQQQIIKSVQDATATTQDIATTQADGVKNIATGEALVAGSAVSNIIPVAGTIVSTTTSQKAAELIAAGTTETTGSISNLKDLAVGIGRIDNNTKLIKTFNKTIGGALDNFDGLIGGWNTVVEPLITSLGTLGVEGVYATQAQSLAETVRTDKDTISKYQEQNQETTETKDTTVTATTIPTQDDKKPEYELETPKFQFGI